MFWSKSESPIRILGTLRILRSNGEETLLSFGDTDTVLALKRRLRELLVTGSEPELVTGKELTPPCSAMRLIFDTDVLLDNWVLGDHGVVDGDQLTLVFSHAPLGKFDCVLETDDPDTWTLATASFAQEGDCCISIVEEDMISIDIEDEYDEYDPYLNGSKWEHWYNGPVEVTGSQLCIVVESSHRLGLFDSIPEPGVLLGEMCDDATVRLQLPFGLSRVTGEEPLRWITLRKEERKICSYPSTDEDRRLPGGAVNPV
ncbi:unnamed protein product [Durusdinium trenchii]|uniref:Ubiquitin-like domain-containing protein n=1 Tax=Durusdinium trenchii TaxID=1381693 RepID=A0ABP0NZR3_9DINO